MEFNDKELEIIRFSLSYLAAGSYGSTEEGEDTLRSLMQRLEIKPLGEE